MSELYVRDSLSEQQHLLRYEDINGENRLFGGKLISWVDEVASIVAMRHCKTRVTTAAIDNLKFKEAAKLNDLVVTIGRATYVGHTSMEIRVDTYVEDLEGFRHPINRAYLTLVSLDENGKPAPIQNKLIVESESEKAEWEAAKKRIAFRKERRESGF